MATELIVVLDVDTQEEALEIVNATGACEWYKIGAQLFTRCGPQIVKDIQGLGKNIFLDLKYHDIPNTVAHAAKGAADLGAGLFTVHAFGGKDMIAGARDAVAGTETEILAVTILTSLSDDAVRNELGLPESASEAVPRLAVLATEAGAHGIVCSPQEIGLVRAAVGSKARIVTPGIRPAWSAKNDQSRIMTPKAAAEAGADMIVVGRPILHHEAPHTAVQLILEELDV